MDDVAFSVEEDVTVVPIFEFEDVGHDGRSDKGIDKILLCLIHSFFGIEDMAEEALDGPAIGFSLFFHGIYGNRIADEFQNA